MAETADWKTERLMPKRTRRLIDRWQPGEGIDTLGFTSAPVSKLMEISLKTLRLKPRVKSQRLNKE